MSLYLALIGVADLEAVSAAVRRLDIASWLFILALALINYQLRFLRWHGFLVALGNRPPIIRHFVIYLAGFALTTTMAKAGEAVRAIYLKDFDVTYARTTALIYAERVLDLLAISLLAAIMMLHSPAGPFRWIAAVGAAIGGLLLLIRLRRIGTACERLTNRLRPGWSRRLLAALTDFHRQTRELLSSRKLMLGLAVGVLAWALEGLATYHVLKQLGLDISFVMALGIYAMAMLIGALSFLPGGLGSTEVAMVSLLTLAGASFAEGVAATAIIRLATLWFAVGLGVAALMGLELTGRRANPAASSKHR